MGRGDTKSARGKISKGSHGKYRPTNKKKIAAKKAAEAGKASGSGR